MQRHLTTGPALIAALMAAAQPPSRAQQKGPDTSPKDGGIRPGSTPPDPGCGLSQSAASMAASAASCSSGDVIMALATTPACSRIRFSIAAAMSG